MIDKSAFCKKFGIDSVELEKLDLDWNDMQAIALDHSRRAPELEIAAKAVVGHLEKCVAVHSLRWRVKDAEHLLDKIVRKARAKPEQKITIENYKSEITDLFGVRALHLFKSDWRAIHQLILKTWHLVENHKPIAYIRDGDEKKSFDENQCSVEIHARDYRSVHYEIQFAPTKEVAIAEIQVRTLFEEGWSEIDHRITYPNNADDPLLSGYLRIFNLLAGASDQMATYIGHLKRELDQLKVAARAKDMEAKKAIEELERIQKQLGAATNENKQLEEIVNSLKRSSGNNFMTIGDLGNIFGSTSTASGSTANLTGYQPRITLGSNSLFAGTKTCSKCGAPLPTNTQLIFKMCPKCNTTYV